MSSKQVSGPTSIVAMHVNSANDGRLEQSLDQSLPPTVAIAASTVGGGVSREEALSRAQSWVNQRVTYTQTGSWAPDIQGKTYRRDCSGLVSMAWHLPTSHTTYTFEDWSGKFVLPSLHDLKAGDAILKSGHIELFARWVDSTQHSAGAYVYSFNSTGETVQNPNAVSNKGNLGKNSWADLNTYKPIRYKNIIDGSTGGSLSGSVLREPDGTICLVVGGAPFHLTPGEYAALGSPKYTSVPAGTFNSMPSTIASGTLVRTDDGAICIVAGSARYHLSPAEYAALGSPGFISVPVRLVDGLNRSPVDNTFLRNPADGAIYHIIGNAKYHLGSTEYAALGNPAFTNVPLQFINSISASVPTEVVFLRDPTTGAIYETVGGAKYHLSSSEYAGLGSPHFTNVAASFINRLGTTPADGTFLRDIADGAICQIIGQGRYHLSEFEYSELDSAPATNVPSGFVASIAQSVPSVGFVRDSTTGAIFQLANGAKYHLSPDEYALLGNPLFVNVPSGVIARAGAIPADGTFLRDIGTGSIFEIVGGASYYLTAAEYDLLGSPAFYNVVPGFAHVIMATIPDRVFLRDSSSGGIYQIVASAKYHLSAEEYAALGSPAFTNVPTGLLSKLGNVLDRSIYFRNVASGEIYLIDKGAKRLLSTDEWYAVSDRECVDVTSGFLATMPMA